MRASLEFASPNFTNIGNKGTVSTTGGYILIIIINSPEAFTILFRLKRDKAYPEKNVNTVVRIAALIAIIKLLAIAIENLGHFINNVLKLIRVGLKVNIWGG